MKLSGAFRERLRSAWTEIRENIGRSVLQALGVMLGVASVLGGFSISDSMRRHSDEAWMKRGGFDKLNVQPAGALRDRTTPSALQNANLGLRNLDAVEGERASNRAVQAVSVERFGSARVRSPFADRDRQIRGIAADYLAMNGYEVEKGRAFAAEDIEKAAPVALLGAEAVSVFFPTGEAVGQVIRIGDTPVTVVGVLKEKVFRWRESDPNVFAWRNRIIALPATLVSRRMQGDAHRRVDRVVFKVPELGLMDLFSKGLTSVLMGTHRQQEDFRLDDIAARVKKRESQGQVYNLVFMLSGILSLIGGGMVNVNIQLASLKERVREVGVKMAIGASGREVFKEFMTEALLLTSLGGLVGFAIGAVFSKVITKVLEVPLWMDPLSFVWAFALALVFGFVFAIYPAWKAARLSPMEALRYE
ncbi:MAG TPA: ABC transporter permease [Thermoanaerobaculia bacterium]|nr:ABC transporter permease [Thermoanaerobaculia bacterium]HQR66076.1 ABC transporter permease [Thermoanaerobaculia bacterium]